jgi:hypothetical protein
VEVEEVAFQEQSKPEVGKNKPQKPAKEVATEAAEPPERPLSSRRDFPSTTKTIQPPPPPKTPRGTHASDGSPSKIFGSSPLTSDSTSNQASRRLGRAPTSSTKPHSKTYLGSRTLASAMDPTRRSVTSDQREEEEVRETLGAEEADTSRSLDTHDIRAESPEAVIKRPAPRKRYIFN